MGATGLRLFFVHQLHHRRAHWHQVLRPIRSVPDSAVARIRYYVFARIQSDALS